LLLGGKKRMPKTKIKQGDREVDVWYQYPALVPNEWMALVRKLHPVTAIIVWEVLNGTLSAETISLAQTSPDWDRFTAIRIVGGGNPAAALQVVDMARAELDEIFDEVLPNYNARRVVH
jgi:hypothetical protein